MNVEFLSSDEMSEVDEKAPSEYGITISRMMENAAYQIADFIRDNYSKETEIVFYIGEGNNGGDGLAAARRLYNWGYKARVELSKEELDGIRLEELEILKTIGVDIVEEGENADIAVDCMIGYNLKGDPRPPYDKKIEQVNTAEEIISVDIPTGVDADTGKRLEPSVEADKILTLAMPKTGLKELDAEIWVLDISVPNRVYDDLGFDIGNLFQGSSRVRLRANH